MIICDTHADTLYAMGVEGKAQPDITPENLRSAGITLQVMALWTGPDGNKGDVKSIVQKELAALETLKARGLEQITDLNGLKEGVPSILLSIEGGEVFEAGLSAVAEYRDLGVRISGLCWNNENLLAHPAKGGCTDGLTPYGRQVTRELQRLKIAVDVSHLNAHGFYDIFKDTNQVPMASHSCCSALCPHFRNLTDDQIRLLIQEQGYIGVNFYPYFLSNMPSSRADVLRHIDHICQLGGAAYVGLGSDFDGIEVKPDGLHTPLDVPEMLQGLSGLGYTEADIERIAGLNFLAYFERIAG